VAAFLYRFLDGVNDFLAFGEPLRLDQILRERLPSHGDAVAPEIAFL
jgi:hypothetical protein